MQSQLEIKLFPYSFASARTPIAFALLQNFLLNCYILALNDSGHSIPHRVCQGAQIVTFSDKSQKLVTFWKRLSLKFLGKSDKHRFVTFLSLFQANPEAVTFLSLFYKKSEMLSKKFQKVVTFWSFLIIFVTIFSKFSLTINCQSGCHSGSFQPFNSFMNTILTQLNSLHHFYELWCCQPTCWKKFWFSKIFFPIFRNLKNIC